jgi:hypothetical protein
LPTKVSVEDGTEELTGKPLAVEVESVEFPPATVIFSSVVSVETEDWAPVTEIELL